MFKIKIYNKIALDRLSAFDTAFTVGNEVEDPDGILVRSYKLHDIEFNKSLKVIGRAGAGVNNIPVDMCTKNDIVVFNTPGANANAVNELVLSGMLLAARNIIEGAAFLNGIKNNENIGKLVEEAKSEFKGFELKGKKLGIIGLGSIGLKVANMAISLGLEVIGFDPFLSEEGIDEISEQIKLVNNLDLVLSESDMISLHIPLSAETRDFLNEDCFQRMKSNVVLLNFSRAEIINEVALLKALEKGSINRYVTDFPNKALLENENVICLPHLGASTREAEENCALMIGKQVADYLINGNIKNSVNFPDIYLEREGSFRLAVTSDYDPGLIEHVTTILIEYGLNMRQILSKSKGPLTYTILDVETEPTEEALEKINSIAGVKVVRLLVERDS
ncbi:3-phosphoglycerate dehydrogenase family protein [Candidatus Margulisiibacteriota bacterium]